MAGTGPVKRIRGDEPIRLFKSDFLEFFTHIHPAVVVAIWLPAIVALLVVAVAKRPEGLWGVLAIPLGFVAGLPRWGQLRGRHQRHVRGPDDR